MKVLILALLLASAFAPRAIAETDFVGKLQRIHSKSDTASYSCVLENGNVRARVDINDATLRIDIDLFEDGSFSGYATRARFAEDGREMIAYNMTNDGLPFFYEFSLIEDLTDGTTRFSLRFGARSLLCASE